MAKSLFSTSTFKCSSPVDILDSTNTDFTGGTGDSGFGTGESDRTAWIYKYPASAQSGNKSIFCCYFRLVVCYKGNGQLDSRKRLAHDYKRI